MSFKVTGMKGFKKNLQVIAEKAGSDAYRSSLLKLLIKIEAEAMRRTPVDTGHLRRSAAGNTVVIKADNKGATGVVVFTANYAVYVHERTELRHEVGEAKFLEKAIFHVWPIEYKKLGETIMTRIYTGINKYGVTRNLDELKKRKDWTE